MEGEWGKLHNVYLQACICAKYITRTIKIKEDEMNRTCNTHRGEIHIKFWSENLNLRLHLRGPGLGGSTTEWRYGIY
jgi:hypothetical protein